MLSHIKHLEDFIQEYGKIYFANLPKYSCILHYFNGSSQTKTLLDLSKLDCMFMFIHGDNSSNYHQFNRYINNNKLVFDVALKQKVLEQTPFPENHESYVYIIFDKVYTPFDNCVDLKLILYRNMNPVTGKLTDDDIYNTRLFLSFLENHGLKVPFESRMIMQTQTNYIYYNFYDLEEMPVTKLPKLHMMTYFCKYVKRFFSFMVKVESKSQNKAS